MNGKRRCVTDNSVVENIPNNNKEIGNQMLICNVKR